MIYQNYDEYMQNVLGGQFMPQPMPYYYVPTYMQAVPKYDNDPYVAMNRFAPKAPVQNPQKQAPKPNEENKMEVAQIKRFYPDIYNILQPMVSKAVRENKEKITNETLENMTMQVYNAVEDEMNINANKTSPTVMKTQIRTTRVENAIKNPTLKDLIKILIINNVLENADTVDMQRSYFNMPYPEDD